MVVKIMRCIGKHMMAALGIVGVCGAMLAGCGQSKGTGLAEQLQGVKQITAPEGVQIVGLGEATHGSSELQTLKKDVFAALVENSGCRVFAIEGDFGGCARVNEYIAGGEGSPEEAAAAIGFAIYRTEEMADLIAWMRDYNASVSEQEQLKFYGFDMQRYDNNKEFLFRYLETVEADLVGEYQDLLVDLNDDTVYSQDVAKVEAALGNVEKLMETMEASKESYLAMTTEREYDFAMQCAQSICENAALRSAGTAYSEMRDTYMKNKVDWIVEHEGGALVFINGHNGHIEKTSASSYTSMGSRLAESYGDAYYAIGTDVREADINVSTSSGEDTTVSIRHKNNLTGQLDNLNENISYLDMTQIPENSKLGQIVSEEMKMVNIGSEFNDWQKMWSGFYTLKMVPKEAYDGLLLIKEGTPTVKL